MENKMYVTKGYSTYTNIPTQQGGYYHNPKHLGNQYVVEAKAIERVRAPTSGYNDYVGSPSKAELLKEYGVSPTMSGGPKYPSKNHYDDYQPNYGHNYENLSPPISPTNHTHGHFSGSGYVRTGYVSGPNKFWQMAGPPATHHPLTTSTNNINDALGLLEESVNHSPRADPRYKGALYDLSTRAQPLDPRERYAQPAFGAKHHYTNRGGATGSHEAMRRYHGSMVP